MDKPEALDRSVGVPDYAFEDVRLRALQDLAILDTAPEEGFDSIVDLATQLCGCPVALVSLVDRDRQWFKAKINFPSCETDLDRSVCAHALVEPDLLVIPDLTVDPRTSANPLVTGEPFIRFYAGAPLRTKDGAVLGSLCVIDSAPRPSGLTAAQAQGLRGLAGQVMALLELRLALREQQTALRQQRVLIHTQKAISLARGDLEAVLDALVTGAMEVMPQADGGVVEMREGEELVYRCARGVVEPQAGLRLPLQGSLAGACLLSGEAILCPDVLQDRRVKADLVEVLHLRSCLVVPVFRAGQVVGVLKLQSGKVAAFTAQDVQVAKLFAGAVTAGLADAALVSQSNMLQTVIDHVAQAVFLMDAAGQVTFANPDAERIFGWTSAELLGRVLHDTLHHSHPDGSTYPADTCRLVTSLREGRHVRDHEDTFFQKNGLPLRVLVTSAPVVVDGHVVSAVFTVSDITARKAAEQRLVESERLRAAALALGDRLRDASAAAEIVAIIGAVLGSILGLSHAGFGQVDHDSETTTVEGEWHPDGLPSVEGQHQFRSYGSYVEELKQGRTVVVADASKDGRTAVSAANLAAIGVRSLVNIPVIERGRFVSLFFVTKAEPHHWTEAEIAFLRNAADRGRAAIARLEAEAQQRVVNEELSHRLKNTLAMVQAIAIQTLKGATDRASMTAFTERVHALSTAHNVLMQESWSAADISVIVGAVLGTFGQSERFRFAGPELRFGARATLSLSLLLHELATNALKYGSLSSPGGRVMISWRIDTASSGQEFVFEWNEVGGPPANPPARKGFGSRLLNMGLLGTGGVTLTYADTGFRSEMRASLAHAQAT